MKRESWRRKERLARPMPISYYGGILEKSLSERHQNESSPVNGRRREYRGIVGDSGNSRDGCVRRWHRVLDRDCFRYPLPRTLKGRFWPMEKGKMAFRGRKRENFDEANVGSVEAPGRIRLATAAGFESEIRNRKRS